MYTVKTLRREQYQFLLPRVDAPICLKRHSGAVSGNEWHLHAVCTSNYLLSDNDSDWYLCVSVCVCMLAEYERALFPPPNAFHSRPIYLWKLHASSATLPEALGRRSAPRSTTFLQSC